MRWRALVLVCALLLGSCNMAQLERAVHDTPSCTVNCGDVSSRPGREAEMNRRWQNHRFSELKAAWGPPRMIMSIPAGGNPPGFAAVYGQDPVSGCIDAFAFTYDADPLIRVYHCR